MKQSDEHTNWALIHVYFPMCNISYSSFLGPERMVICFTGFWAGGETKYRF